MNMLKNIQNELKQVRDFYDDSDYEELRFSIGIRKAIPTKEDPDRRGTCIFIYPEHDLIEGQDEWIDLSPLTMKEFHSIGEQNGWWTTTYNEGNTVHYEHMNEISEWFRQYGIEI